MSAYPTLPTIHKPQSQQYLKLFTNYGNNMIDYNPFEFDVKSITSITPVYDYDTQYSRTKGHFNIQLGFQEGRSFSMRFSSVINHRAQQDSNLFDFLMNNYSEKSLSAAVRDLYDVGFPVDEWVVEYIEFVLQKNNNFSAMLNIMNTLRKFNEDLSEDDDPLI